MELHTTPPDDYKGHQIAIHESPTAKIFRWRGVVDDVVLDNGWRSAWAAKEHAKRFVDELVDRGTPHL